MHMLEVNGQVYKSWQSCLAVSHKWNPQQELARTTDKVCEECVSARQLKE